MVPTVEGLEQLEEVGRGGFGVVYRGWQPAFARFVAVKVLPADRGDPDTRLRVEREALALGSLSGHPNIVAIHSAGVTDAGEPYFVMPFLSGGSLDDRILVKGVVPWPETVSIGVKIAGSLHTAHMAGGLHRDVKPDNILFSDFGEPQLADFGIARLAGRQHTQGSSVATTILFAAPEVLSGSDPEPASDVYSLACTIYASIVGHAPFWSPEGVPLASTIARVVGDTPTRPPAIPDGLWSVLERGMAKSPTDRQGSAAEFGRGLQRVQRMERLAVTPIALPGGLADDPEATVIVQPPEPLRLGDSRATIHLDTEPKPASTSGNEPEHRRRWPVVAGLSLSLLLAIGGGMWVLFTGTYETGGAESASTTSAGVTVPVTATSSTSPQATTPTTGVTAERPSRGVDLFNGAIQALTPFSLDLSVLALSSSGETETPENEAALLGAWYSLADWCVAEEHGLEGTCYDLAAEFLTDRFPRDPRTINTQTWPGSGAIGGVIDSGYNIGQQYLGLPPLQPPTIAVTSNGNRPGQDILCEPSCSAVLDG